MTDLTPEEHHEMLMTANRFRSVWAVGPDGRPIDTNQWDAYLPDGTTETTGRDGSISHWGPVTKRCMEFHDVHTRNAWIMCMRNKGIFTKRDTQ